MKKNHINRKILSLIIITGSLISALCLSGCSKKEDSKKEGSEMDGIISNMTMDEKISQMIIPAIRTWDGENVTDIDDNSELRDALQKHQYCGVILFGSNIIDNEQVYNLVKDLQDNNKQSDNVSVHIPYIMPLDEEGGIVVRLTSGTRMTGNMAIGATTDAEGNALKTGEIIGEELAALGFNTDYAPDIDVNNNPSNPVIGTRSFSDDPEVVAKLGKSFADGLKEKNIIATYKHYPGHGDTETDSHIGTPSVEKTYDEIKEVELVPFKEAINNGADMIMTAHITYPLIDDEVTFGDGVTKGYYPATMSRKMITDILRDDLGFNGVVVTDALEMKAIRTAGLVKGEEGTVEYGINVAREVINAGVDILLIPTDLNNEDAAAYYDDYINGISELVKSGEISSKRIDESVRRILVMKNKYHIFDIDGGSINESEGKTNSENHIEEVGSKAHHEDEMEIARKAITLLKNDEDLIPLAQDKKDIVFLGRQKNDSYTINYAIDEMKKEGLISEDSNISVEYYYDSSADVKLNYTDDMKNKISSADIVIAFSYASGSAFYDKENPQYIALHSALKDVHDNGGKFILLSENLPYDAAVYSDADGIVLSYMGSGLNIDPTDKTSDGVSKGAINANIIAAIETIFGYNKPKGKLPVNVPELTELEDGTYGFGSNYLYERGSGLLTE